MPQKKLLGRAKISESLMQMHQEELQLAALFDERLARSVKLHPTDLQTLRYVVAQGPATAGDLKNHTGLTTGAITNVIDRLEKLGYVRRQVDTKDRRKVLVRSLPQKLRRITALEERMEGLMEQVLASYTLEELAIIKDFLTNMGALYKIEGDLLL